MVCGVMMMLVLLIVFEGRGADDVGGWVGGMV